jgi:uncharacterized membrane protein YphA (DoxX/SURF4 family)
MDVQKQENVFNFLSVNNMLVFFRIYGWDLFLLIIRLIFSFLSLKYGIYSLNNWNESLDQFSTLFPKSTISPAWLFFVNVFASLLLPFFIIIGKFVRFSSVLFISLFCIFQINNIVSILNPEWLFFILIFLFFGSGRLNLQFLKK